MAVVHFLFKKEGSIFLVVWDEEMHSIFCVQ
jgi:hypothetical protein